MRSKAEIEDQLNKAMDVIHDPDERGAWGMSYEEGVQAALDWVVENIEEGPMDGD